MATVAAHDSTSLNSDTEDFSDTELLESLEADAELSSYREKRLEQLKQEFTKIKEDKETFFGNYTEIYHEKEVLQLTTTCAKCVVHFYHKDFRRCAIMDVHLQLLATKYPKTKFIKINVDNATFLIHHLKVKILPCVIFFLDGITKERIIGFEELGNTDDFPTSLLEKRLCKAKVISDFNNGKQGHFNKSILQGSLKNRDLAEYDDDDIDD